MEEGLEHRRGCSSGNGVGRDEGGVGADGGMCGKTGDVQADKGYWADRGGKGRLWYVKGITPCSTPFSILSTQNTCFRQILAVRGVHMEGGPFEGLDFWKEFFVLWHSTDPHSFHFPRLWDMYQASLGVATILCSICCHSFRALF